MYSKPTRVSMLKDKEPDIQNDILGQEGRETVLNLFS